MSYASTVAFAAAELAYLAPPAGFAGDAPDTGVTAECTPEACAERSTCEVCGQPLCPEHPARDQHVDTEAFDGCQGRVHKSCHDQTCTDRTCWYDDPDPVDLADLYDHAC